MDAKTHAAGITAAACYAGGCIVPALSDARWVEGVTASLVIVGLIAMVCWAIRMIPYKSDEDTD